MANGMLISLYKDTIKLQHLQRMQSCHTNRSVFNILWQLLVFVVKVKLIVQCKCQLDTWMYWNFFFKWRDILFKNFCHLYEKKSTCVKVKLQKSLSLSSLNSLRVEKSCMSNGYLPLFTKKVSWDFSLESLI